MPVEIRVPQLGESVVEATIARWLKQPGDAVAAGEPVVELETDKVNVEVPAEADGVLGEIARPEGETVAVGEVLAALLSPDTAGTPAPAAPAAAAAAGGGESAGGGSPGRNGGGGSGSAAGASATPVAQKIAEQNDIDLREVKGSGPGGKITKDDVANRIEQKQSAPATANVKVQEAVETLPPPPPGRRAALRQPSRRPRHPLPPPPRGGRKSGCG
jgi:2-oxoglutarate dehydrogenase E2 component (dihydrolipoamide succinyltransferase)